MSDERDEMSLVKRRTSTCDVGDGADAESCGDAAEECLACAGYLSDV